MGMNIPAFDKSLQLSNKGMYDETVRCYYTTKGIISMNGKLNLLNAKETRLSSDTNHIALHNMLLGRFLSNEIKSKQKQTN